MPTYTLDGEDNEIVGTPSGDTVSGFTGGTDTVSTLGGNDRVSVIRNVPIIPFVDGNGVVHYRIDYPNLGDPIRGSFDGGAGIDTLHVGVTDIKDSSRDGNIIIDLTDVAISGFERLEIGYITQMTVAQLQPFTVFKGESTGLFHVILDGPGGVLDLSAVTTTATLHEINGILLDSALTFTGTARADHVTDTRHADVIDGGGGNDVIFTWGEEADNLSGGAGTDTLQIYGFWPGTFVHFDPLQPDLPLPNGLVHSGFERYEITGGGGNDQIYGNALADILDGGAGNDRLYGRGGNDVLLGRNLLFSYGDGLDELYGGDGNDKIYACAGDFASGGNGHDIIVGSLGSNTMHGDAGNDNLISYGYDELFGDAGDDRLQVHGRGAVLNGGAGRDVLRTFENGTPIVGSSANRFNGGDGDDVLYAGDQGYGTILDGGAGADEMWDGPGDDVFIVDPEDTIHQIPVLQDRDRIEADFSYVLPNGVEVLRLIGSADIDGRGNTWRNVLYGNDGDNWLDGGAESDMFWGGLGDDTYIVDRLNEYVVENPGEGDADRVAARVSHNLTPNTEIELLTTASSAGAAAIDLTGNAYAQTVIGNAGSNILDGRAGSDTLRGLGGKDFFDFSSALGPTNVDTIADFKADDDTIRLDNTVFAALTITGTLAASAFKDITGGPKDADDRIIYNSSTGNLYYDADGSGAAFVNVKFATLTGSPTLTAADFMVI